MNKCCKPIFDGCQEIAECFETLTLTGLTPDTADKVTFYDLLGNQFVIDIISSGLGEAIVNTSTLPESFFNSFSRVFFLRFENHIIEENGKTYKKLLFTVSNKQTNETNQTIEV